MKGANHDFPVFKQLLSLNKRVPTREVAQLYKDKFEPLMSLMYNNGMQHVMDEVYIQHGFAVDKDMDNNDKINKAGISQENQQRAKCLTAPAEIERRVQREQLIELELKRKADEGKAKANQKRAEDQAVVDELCALAEVESSEDNVGSCTLVHMSDTMKAPQLRAWILEWFFFCVVRFVTFCELFH